MINGRYGSLVLIIGTMSIVGCTPDPRSPAMDQIDTADLARHIQTLASDEFEGRRPSSPGEERTVAYLQEQFENIGLEPGNGSSYFQDVPLVSITVKGRPSLTIAGRGTSSQHAYAGDYVGWTKRVVDQVSLRNSDMVFVGYGIVAPEYDWNDYDGVDVRGKTVVILVNDPGYATKDSTLFNGNSMTYYGRWTYKYEEAARQGAAGALIIHETGAAGYPWEVVTGSWTGPQFDLVRDDNNMGRAAVEGWITNDLATELFARSSLDLAQLREVATQRGFHAVPLGLTASVTIDNVLERSNSKNVLGVLPGGERPDEYIVYMAHWDHFGRDTSLTGDQIYNGAFDNATGTAGLLELAQAFTALEQKPARSIVFLAVTAEEQGLLGSAYYATHPVYPTNQTVAAINMDGLNNLGPMRDITVVGWGNSELDDYLQRAAAEVHRAVRPDPEPEKGFYYRSDHFSFAKVGVPALYTDAGIDNIEHGEEWTLAKRDEYTEQNYHKPSDEFDPSWDLSGAVDDLRILFAVGYELANSNAFPNWRAGNEFKAIRDSDMASGRSGTMTSP